VSVEKDEGLNKGTAVQQGLKEKKPKEKILKSIERDIFLRRPGMGGGGNNAKGGGGTKGRAGRAGAINKKSILPAYKGADHRP